MAPGTYTGNHEGELKKKFKISLIYIFILLDTKYIVWQIKFFYTALRSYSEIFRWDSPLRKTIMLN